MIAGDWIEEAQRSPLAGADAGEAGGSQPGVASEGVKAGGELFDLVQDPGAGGLMSSVSRLHTCCSRWSTRGVAGGTDARPAALRSRCVRTTCQRAAVAL